MLSHNLLSGRREGNTVWMVWLEAVTPKHQIDFWLSLIPPNYDFPFSMLLRSSNLPTCKFKSFYSLHKSSPKIKIDIWTKYLNFYPAIYLPNPLLRSPKSVSDCLFRWQFFDSPSCLVIMDHDLFAHCTPSVLCQELAKHRGSTSTPTSSSKRFLASEGFWSLKTAYNACACKLWFTLFATCRRLTRTRLTRTVILWKQSYEYYNESLIIMVPLCVIDLACKT